MTNIIIIGFFAQIICGVLAGSIAWKGFSFFRFRGNEFDRFLVLIALTCVICFVAQFLLKFSIPPLLIVSVLGAGVWQSKHDRLWF